MSAIVTFGEVTDGLGDETMVNAQRVKRQKKLHFAANRAAQRSKNASHSLSDNRLRKSRTLRENCDDIGIYRLRND
jgi:hypothetical protein